MKLENLIDKYHGEKIVVATRINKRVADEFKVVQEKLLKDGMKLKLSSVVEQALIEMIEQAN